MSPGNEGVSGPLAARTVDLEVTSGWHENEAKDG